jgi:hypothetical protein
LAEEHDKKEERDDADAGTLLKTMIDRLDSLHKRMDAMEEKEEPEPVAADKKKKDSEEKEEKEERKDAKEKEEDDSTVFYRGNKAPKKDAKKDSREDSEEEEEKEDRKDSRRAKDDSREDDDSRKKDDDSRKDSRRRDDEDEKEEKRDDKARKMKRDDEEEDERDDDDSRRDRADSSDIRRRIDRVERMLPKQLSDSDRAAFSDVQATADDVYHAFGKRAPGPMSGESLMAYRQRIVKELKQYSPTWKEVNIYAIADDKGFEAIERTVYSDAMAVAHSPATVEPGTLRMITKMSGGHEIHTFEGEARAWMDSMAGPVRMHVTNINTPNNGAR